MGGVGWVDCGSVHVVTKLVMCCSTRRDADHTNVSSVASPAVTLLCHVGRVAAKPQCERVSAAILVPSKGPVNIAMLSCAT